MTLDLLQRIQHALPDARDAWLWHDRGRPCRVRTAPCRHSHARLALGHPIDPAQVRLVDGPSDDEGCC
jgi:hypothetical protein